MQLARLLEPFPEKDIQTRIGRCGDKNGKCWATLLCYVDARAVQERLDEVFGVLGWQTRYQTDDKGVVCEITVKDERGNLITKSDGANYTEFESYKGGISDAFKRAAAAGLGIGRYLYNLEQNFAYGEYTRKVGWLKGYIKDTQKEAWFPPVALPKWALPGGEGHPPWEKPVEAPKRQGSPQTLATPPAPQKSLQRAPVRSGGKRAPKITGKQVNKIKAALEGAKLSDSALVMWYYEVFNVRMNNLYDIAPDNVPKALDAITNAPETIRRCER
jgi:hypothetical protein